MEEYDYPEQDETEAALGLPNDSRSIRDNIGTTIHRRINAFYIPHNDSPFLPPPLVDVFSCDGRPYGYYADVANECQIFHICTSHLR